MKKIVAISALSVLAAGAVAVGVQQMRRPADAMTADLERDLSLATSVQRTRTGVVSAIEQAGTGAPSGAEKGLRAPVVTKKRAMSASPSRQIAEVAAAPANEAPAPAIAPPTVAEPLEQVAATPEPTVKASSADPNGASGPVAVGGPSSGGVGEGDHGMDTRGNGRTGTELPPPTMLPPTTVAGVISSVILRGGGAGHDNCEPAAAGRRGASPAVGMIGAMGGVILNGGGMPRGSLPGGNRGGRRW